MNRYKKAAHDILFNKQVHTASHKDQENIQDSILPEDTEVAASIIETHHNVVAEDLPIIEEQAAVSNNDPITKDKKASREKFLFIRMIGFAIKWIFDTLFRFIHFIANTLLSLVDSVQGVLMTAGASILLMIALKHYGFTDFDILAFLGDLLEKIKDWF